MEKNKVLSSSELQSVIQVAIMYYKERLNQQEIAECLGLTRQTVSKMLQKAEEEGVVEFRIHNPFEVMADLSQQLVQKFNLSHGTVIPCRFADTGMITTVLAQYAGQYVVNLIEQGAINIGLSWGRTMYQTILNMPSAHCENAVFFPLVGASNRTAEYFMINEMVRKAADTVNASPSYAYIPADPGSSEDVALFRRTSTYEAIEQHWNNIDLAVMGIGVHPKIEQGMRIAYPGEKNMLPSINGVVGDMLTHYFDVDGNFIRIDDAEILCASIENLRNAKRVLAIAGGKTKTTAIAGALKTGIITDLITDQQTCSHLLRANV